MKPWYPLAVVGTPCHRSHEGCEIRILVNLRSVTDKVLGESLEKNTRGSVSPCAAAGAEAWH